MIIRALVIAVLFLSLAGCRVEATTHIKVSDFTNTDIGETSMDLRIRLDSCMGMNSPAAPSEDLMRIKQVLLSLFPNVEHTNCLHYPGNSWAEFSLPVSFIHHWGELSRSHNTIHFLVPEDIELSLGIFVPESFRGSLRRIDPEKLGGTSLDAEIHIVIENDTAEIKHFGGTGVWVDNSPMAHGRFSIPSGESKTLRLSDITLSSIYSHQYAPVLWDSRSISGPAISLRSNM